MKFTKEIEALIPGSKLQAVENACEAVFGNQTIEACQLITTGLSSALIYKVTVAAKHYLIRVIMHIGEYSDPGREYACMKAAADSIIAPQVHYSNEKDAVSVTDFITALPASQAFQTHSDFLVSLAKSIHSIHTLPLFPRLVNFLYTVQLFVQQFQQAGMFPAEVTAKHLDHFSEIMNSYPRCEDDMVSSHNDLNPGNILADGKKLWIIDWDTAFTNDRYVDLSLASISFVRDTEQEEIFLAAYFGREVTACNKARFFIMQQAGLMYYAMLILKIAASAKPQDFSHDANMLLPDLPSFYQLLGSGEVSLETYEGQLQYGKILLNSMLTNMETLRFRQSLDVIRSL
jgi:aminoglycoside phosphotransferase (APT) family kinase protein